MQSNHRKRRVQVAHRGHKVPNLYKRPKPSSDRREGETYEVIFRDETGKQRQKTLNARTVQRALVEAEEYRSKLRRGEVVSSSRFTFGEVADEYFGIMEALVATGERSQRTFDVYQQRFRTHVEPVMGRCRMHELRSEHIGAVFARQRKRGLASWTLAGTQTTISAILSFALSRGYIANNPLARLAKIDKPRQVSEREPRRLNDEETRSLCNHATPRYRPIVTTLAWTGLRVSEALALRWEDVDFERRDVCVRFQLTDEGALKKPKTKAGIRTVPLLPLLEQTLREHRKEQLRQGIASPAHLVFTTATGKPLNRHNVRNQGIRVAAEKAGLHGDGETTLTTHDLRRTFISHLIVRLGLDPVRVSKIAGHSNVAVTLNTYADEFDKAQHRDDLNTRIEKAGFGHI